MARQKAVFEKLSASRNRSQHQRRTLTILILLILPPALATYTTVPPSLHSLILTYALAINIGTFFAYRHDKHAARDGRWRVRELSLHLWALAGGWPAAFVAQRVLRHKTRKWRFLVVFWMLVVGEEVLCLILLRGGGGACFAGLEPLMKGKVA